MDVSLQLNLRVRIEGLHFRLSNSVIVIEPDKLDDEYLHKLENISKKLFDKLPHTPITAIGHNFKYKLEEDENFKIGSDFDAKLWHSLYSGVNSKGFELSTLKHTIKLDDDFVLLNLSYSLSSEMKQLEMNFHYQVNQDKDKINDALLKYVKNYEKAEEFIKILINDE